MRKLGLAAMVAMVLVLAACEVSFTSAADHSHARLDLTAASGPSKNSSSPSERSIQTFAQLPNAYSFAGTPVLSASGRNIVTLVEHGGDDIPTHRPATIELRRTMFSTVPTYQTASRSSSANQGAGVLA